MTSEHTLPRPCCAFVLLWLSVKQPWINNVSGLLHLSRFLPTAVDEVWTHPSLLLLFFGKPFQFLAKRKTKKIHDSLILPFHSEWALREISLQTARRLNLLNPPLCFPHSSFNENEFLLLDCQDWVVEGEFLQSKAGSVGREATEQC